MRPVFLQYLIVAVTSVASLVSTASPSTSSPTVIISDIQQADPAVFCIDCGEPFDAHTRRKILKRLANNPYIAQLRKGLYFPDSAQPFVSKVHFDNCDFDAGLDHLASLMDEVASYARAAEATTDNAERDDAVSHAFFALGQALHSIQDFYAHSNYVELQMAKVQRMIDIDIIALWRKDARQQIELLQKERLVSGVVFWGVPQKCLPGTPSYTELAKSTATTASGSQLVAHLQNINRYAIARFLAVESSLSLLTDAFRQWPILAHTNGRVVAFEVLLDHQRL